MKKSFHLIITVFLCIYFVFAGVSPVYAEEAKKTEDNSETGPEIQGSSAIVMESSTGKVICEKNADQKLPPASVTKIMTLLLIFDAIADGQIHLSDEVTVSEYAASMGGSQVFLEPGETQTVETMIKCIAVASANDACVAFKNGRQLYLQKDDMRIVNGVYESAKIFTDHVEDCASAQIQRLCGDRAGEN